MRKQIYWCLFLGWTCIMFSKACFAQTKKGSGKVIVAYLTSWTEEIPDPLVVTHINYAFGHVNKTFNGVSIANPERLKKVVALKNNTPQLKVLLSIGGWGSGGFSEMAHNDSSRDAFAKDCAHIIADYNLDGIDIDWEFPGSSMAKIGSSPDDRNNYTLLMKAIRNAIGNNQLLTLASQSGAGFIDFKEIEPVIDFVNIMAYDMAGGDRHHAGLYRSGMSAGITADESVTAHLKAGIPADKLVLGIPFYGHGRQEVPRYINYKDIVQLTGYQQKWDDIAKAPYLTDSAGTFVCTYETPQSIAIKCRYLLAKGLRGAMYWDYAGDTAEGQLRQAVYKGIFQSSK